VKQFQIVQSFLSFGSGGLFGVGLGEGKQKLFFLPAPHTDFIFSLVGEELGLVGAMVVLLLFFIIMMRGVHIAYSIEDRFGAYLAMGITLMISLQAVINMGVVLGLLPTKGLTLPFISYGGTSLVTSLVAVGILLSFPPMGAENKDHANRKCKIRSFGNKAETELLEFWVSGFWIWIGSFHAVCDRWGGTGGHLFLASP
jgi:cell division protein FtsW (lipid II flippase)